MKFVLALLHFINRKSIENKYNKVLFKIDLSAYTNSKNNLKFNLWFEDFYDRNRESIFTEKYNNSLNIKRMTNDLK